MSRPTTATEFDEPGRPSIRGIDSSIAFMTEFDSNMRIFNQSLMPSLLALAAVALNQDNQIRYHNGLLGGLRQQVTSLESRVTAIEANTPNPPQTADNPSFMGEERLSE